MRLMCGSKAIFYLYRAIDLAGATIDFFLSAFRSAAAAKGIVGQGLAA
jgi:transposase-like protein